MLQPPFDGGADSTTETDEDGVNLSTCSFVTHTCWPTLYSVIWY